MDNWVIPLTLLPGIGMIIMSTSHLSTATSDEINQLLRDDLCDTSLIKKKISQLFLLNLAKVGLYISIAVFSVAGLIEAIFTLQSEMHDSGLRTILLIIGVSTLVLATLLLIVFSTRKVKIKRDQFLNRINP
ncbi:hypothetical protein BFP97_10645 [Roseivirga sp. 4D4]|uniref:hypothetical protein n=1 Tax=Roseivirga sp. 4D4 TaxID=1889784 RepID=UPI000852B466|nr:hypothetical protein [Roseivirga sp. 4D4]OEK01947.1 hypothetical protein BFP97_10645 [Roseivirga sp. 4D4]